MRSFRIILLHAFAIPFCLALILALPANAQITSVTNDQSTPVQGAGHDYIHLLTETVNPANGSLSLSIQVPVPKGRGLTLPFAFAYDSNGFAHLQSDGANDGRAIWLSNATFLSQGGWAYSTPQLSLDQFTLPWFNGGGSCSFTTDYIFQDPNGGRHALGLSTSNDGQGGNGDAACGISPVAIAGDDLV